jgi:poly(hydroxyalkanoate) depolymerase family esterase
LSSILKFKLLSSFLSLVLPLAFLLIVFPSCKKRRYEKKDLHSLENFGGNEGNLRAFYYEPINPEPDMPLVVVLHGCSQTALGASKLTEWNLLADRYGFYVLYPEQKRVNNATKCFNWFQTKDNEKGKGECGSIINMVGEMNTKFSINLDSIFVTGMSAGAAMSMIMISTYPSSFQGASIMSGGPYKGAEGLSESYKALRGKISKSDEQWGNLVRAQNVSYSGSYAKVVIFHGKKDNTVDFNNSDEIVKQWTNVTGIGQGNMDAVEITQDIKALNYRDSNGEIWVKKYEIAKMGHQLSVDPGQGETQGGGKGVFANDKDFFSTYWTAKFFGLIK